MELDAIVADYAAKHGVGQVEAQATVVDAMADAACQNCDTESGLRRFLGLDGGTPMPDAPLDEATQTAMLKMEAKQGQLLTDAIAAIRTGKFADLDTIYCALKDIPKPDYTPTYPNL